MKRLLILIALLVAACGGPGTQTGGGDGSGTWSYGKGPHGENCLFYSEGVALADNRVLAMDCDEVRP